jgi:hypothetical protein
VLQFIYDAEMSLFKGSVYILPDTEENLDIFRMAGFREETFRIMPTRKERTRKRLSGTSDIIRRFKG